MAKEVKKDTAKVEGVITAAYKVNLHCQQCAREIRNPLMRIQGVHKVEVAFEKNEIKVTGMIDAKRIHERIEKLSKKKVELVSPQLKIVNKESTKEPTFRKTSVKVHMHCEKCELDLRKRLLKHKGIYSVKTDFKAQTLVVEGTIESEILLGYIRKSVHKHAEILTPKPEKKEEKKESVKVEAKIAEIVEFKEEKKVEVKDKEGNVPYFVHYVYAPQLFSDENPNACSVM